MNREKILFCYAKVYQNVHSINILVDVGCWLYIQFWGVEGILRMEKLEGAIISPECALSPRSG